MTSQRYFLFILAAIAFPLVIVPFAVQDEIFAFIHWIEGFMREMPVLGAVVFFLVSAASVLVAFFSAAVIVPSAVLVWGSLGAFLLLYAGWITGGVLTYGIGRLFGKSAVRRFVRQERLARYEDAVSHRMPFWAVALLVVSVPAEIPGYLLGILRYPFWKFLLALSLAELPFALVSVYASGELLQGRYFGFFVTVALLGLAAWFASQSFARRAKRKRQESL